MKFLSVIIVLSAPADFEPCVLQFICKWFAVSGLWPALTKDHHASSSRRKSRCKQQRETWPSCTNEESEESDEKEGGQKEQEGCEGNEGNEGYESCHQEKKRGQADSMVGGAWKAWIAHLERVGPTWLYVFAIMSHCLCARVTEVMKLTLEHVDFEKGMVHIDSLKRQTSVDKPMLKALFDQMETWKQNGGVKVTRTRKCGSRGLATFQDHWSWPTDSAQEFFPAKRSDCNGSVMNNKDNLLLGFLSLTFDLVHCLLF